ncbi:aspartate carbamoyltransferase, partial [Opitutae bacterium]|nr:aspartate carbamoyltransferase [Opitutae bacterium]
MNSQIMSRVLTWEKQNLISIEPLSLAEINTIFTLARYYKQEIESGQLKFDALQGRTVINLFLEPSTRTRLAFEIACKRLSADSISVSGGASSLSKGESLKDTACNIAALGA